MRKLLISSYLFILIFLASCSGKINKDNYNKITNGMTISQVESILGKGESLASSDVNLGDYGGKISSEVITWEDGTNIISITFSNGEVMSKVQSGL